MNIAKLDQKIRAVCHAHGVSVGKKSDKKTWRIDFTPEATEAEKKAAQAVIDAFDETEPAPVVKSVEERLAALEAKVFGK